MKISLSIIGMMTCLHTAFAAYDPPYDSDTDTPLLHPALPLSSLSSADVDAVLNTDSDATWLLTPTLPPLPLSNDDINAVLQDDVVSADFRAASSVSSAINTHPDRVKTRLGKRKAAEDAEENEPMPYLLPITHQENKPRPEAVEVRRRLSLASTDEPELDLNLEQTFWTATHKSKGGNIIINAQGYTKDEWEEIYDPETEGDIKAALIEKAKRRLRNIDYHRWTKLSPEEEEQVTRSHTRPMRGTTWQGNSKIKRKIVGRGRPRLETQKNGLTEEELKRIKTHPEEAAGIRARGLQRVKERRRREEGRNALS
jgi:hypothetical protein